ACERARRSAGISVDDRMTLRLTVDRRAWEAHVDSLLTGVPGITPVVKGNGYGFGRARLAEIARQHAVDGDGLVAVGTVYEAADVGDAVPMVLAPHVGDLPASLPPHAVLCVGAVEHVHALADAGWRGAVHLKLASS